jgi:O-antigen ligase
MVILWRSLNARDAQTKVAGLMGMALVSGFFIFGLTVEIFNLKMTAAFYALTLAVLMAAATNRNEGH